MNLKEVLAAFAIAAAIFLFLWLGGKIDLWLSLISSLFTTVIIVILDQINKRFKQKKGVQGQD